jgi:tRNA threonylcarbamoyladenosine biosynthesis protein TsaE
MRAEKSAGISTAQLDIVAPDEASMVACGARLAAACEAGLVVFLQGELGMGKTTFSRGVIRALGHSGAVKSPTYTLVEPYQLRELQLYHFDLYRLSDPEELEFMGIRDYFTEESICLVEWPERGTGALPPADLVINIEREGSGRKLTLCGATVLGNTVVRRMRAQS